MTRRAVRRRAARAATDRVIRQDGLVFGLELIVALVSTVIVGTVIGRRYRVGPPVLLILMGVLLGLVPISVMCGSTAKSCCCCFFPRSCTGRA